MNLIATLRSKNTIAVMASNILMNGMWVCVRMNELDETSGGLKHDKEKTGKSN